MQISNNTLLQLLVEELPKHGGWPERAVRATQSVLDGEIYFRDRFDQLINRGIKLEKVAKIQSVRITRDQYEAALAASKETLTGIGVDGWIDWAGGDCPVESCAVVDVMFRYQENSATDHAGAWRWNHNGTDSDIIAYRLHKPQDANSRANDDRLDAAVWLYDTATKDDLIMDVLMDMVANDVNMPLREARDLADLLITLGYRKQ